MSALPSPGARPAERSRIAPPRPRRPIASAPDLDPLDRLIGRAAVDARFCALLLADPVTALRPEQMPLRLKRALIAIRARTLGHFAVRALDIQTGLRVSDRLGRVARPTARPVSAARRRSPRASASDPAWRWEYSLPGAARIVALDRHDAPRPAPPSGAVRDLA